MTDWRRDSIHDIARVAGAYAWSELELCAILSRWAADTESPRVAAFLGARCHTHAWHADLWRQRIPAVPGITVDDFVVAPDDPHTTLLAEVGATPAHQVIERIVGLYGVLLPLVVSTYQSHLDATNADTDAPTVRVLTLVMRDEVDDLNDGRLLLESLVVSEDDRHRAVRHQRHLAQIVDAAGRSL